MELKGKSFRDLLHDDRRKRLARTLKLKHIKRPLMSISGISSINGDNQLSDVSYYNPVASSSRASSVIVTSSIQLKNKLLPNVQLNEDVGPGAASEIDQAKAMMPPPPPVPLNRKQSGSSNSLQQIQHKQEPVSPCVPLQTSEVNVPRHSNKPKQRSITFTEWIVRLTDRGEIIIRGRLESGDRIRSKPVTKRITATTLHSIRYQYHLVGDIYDTNEELPEYIRGKFYNGFPTDWESVRQIWRDYIVSGCSLRYRWPQPIADNDDDLRSEITDLTILHPITTERNLTTITTPPPSSPHKITPNRPGTNTASGAIETAGTSIQNQITESTIAHTQSVDKTTTSEKRIPEWKIDQVIDNLMNKNCSMEYLHKIVIAIDSINDLFATPWTNNIKVQCDEEVSANRKTGSETNAHTRKDDEAIVKERQLTDAKGRRARTTRNAMEIQSNYYSLESCSENETDSMYNHETFVSKQSKKLGPIGTTVGKSIGSPQYRESAIAPKTPNSCKYVNNNHKESQVALMSSKNRSYENSEGQSKLASMYHKAETLEFSNRAATPVNESLKFVTSNSEKVPVAKRQCLLTVGEANMSIEATADSHSDSDISIIDTTPRRNTRILRNGSAVDDRKKSNIRKEQRRPQLSNCNGNGLQLAELESTPTGNLKSRSDVSQHINDLIRSDLENVSTRVSSRGRCIVPPLAFWNGERVSIKGQDLVYTPGVALRNTSLSSAVSGNSFLSTTNTACSEPLLVQSSTKSLSTTPGPIVTCSTSTINYTKQTIRQNRGVLSERSSDNNANPDPIPEASDNRLKRTSQKTKRLTRPVEKNTNSSSSPDEEIPLRDRRKRRKLHN